LNLDFALEDIYLNPFSNYSYAVLNIIEISLLNPAFVDYEIFLLGSWIAFSNITTDA